MARPRPAIPQHEPLIELPTYPDEDSSARDVLGDTSRCSWCGVAHTGGPEFCEKAPVLTIEEREELLKDTYPAIGVVEDVEEDEEPDRPLSTSPENEPQFIYLAGTAGTGKSFQARQRAEDYTDAILMATTGIAAVNLGGTTINSVLRYFDTGDMQTSYEFGRLGIALRNLGDSGFTRLIVDEVSMMDGRQLTILCTALDEVNERRVSDGKRPMGITLVGDFAQLPPVNAPYAFQSPVWDRFDANTTLLTEPRRHADPAFVAALQQVRRGDQTAIDYFRQFITKSEDREFQGTSILAKNDEVDRYNKIRMIELKQPEQTFTNRRTGELNAEWKHIPDTLVLKPTCLVMILSNRFDKETREIIYANGDLGYYQGKLDENTAKVKLLRTGYDVHVSRVVRERKFATGKKGIKAPREEKHGSLDYMPLRAAYASTVHRSQGLSLDRVQLMINSQFWLQSGMIYVGLSRARTPQGLRIVGTVDQFVARVRVNPLLERWL